MLKPTIIALDLEGTLISNAVSQFPRPGLRRFLDFCGDQFNKVFLYTAVRDELVWPIIEIMVEEGTAPEWLRNVELVQWDRNFKDLANIPNASIQECLIVDDNPDYILVSQRTQWIEIEKYESPYPDDDEELTRVMKVIKDISL